MSKTSEQDSAERAYAEWLQSPAPAPTVDNELLGQAIKRASRIIEMIEYLQEHGDGATVDTIPNVDIVASYVDKHGDKIVLTVDDLKLLLIACQHA